jgi:hypothetical protein
MQAVLLISTIAVWGAAQTTGTNGTISGRLSLRNGTPAAGARIVALAEKELATGQSTLRIATTDSQGRYRLEDVPPGRYFIATGPLTRLTYFPSVTNQAQAVVVTVPTGGKVADIDFRLTTVRVSGRASGGGSGRDLRLGPGDNAPASTVAADGSFLFENVSPGTYRLVLPSPSRGTVPRTGSPACPVLRGCGAWTAPIAVLAEPVVVGDDDVTNVQLWVGPVMSFPVIVSVEGGGPPPSFKLRFEDGRAPERRLPPIEVAATASFDAQIPDTQLRLASPDLPPGFVLRSATLVYPSGATTSILQKVFTTHQVARMTLVLGRQ